MLKLLKYEAYAVTKRLLPLYILIIVLPLITRITYSDGFVSIMDYISNKPYAADITSYLLITSILFAGSAAAVLTAVLLIQRFYSNLMCNEGYLMNTLPVESWQIVLSKLIAAVICLYCGMAAAFLCVFLLAGSNVSISAFKQVWHNLTDIYSIFDLLKTFAAATLGIVQLILRIYTSISIGQLANKHKGIISVCAYIIINIIISLAMQIIPHYTAQVIICIICFFASSYILKYRLNLE